METILWSTNYKQVIIKTRENSSNNIPEKSNIIPQTECIQTSCNYIFIVVPIICGSSKWYLLHVTILAFRILKLLPDFSKISARFRTIINIGLFEMIIGVLTTCHTQHTWDRSMYLHRWIKKFSKFSFMLCGVQ
jgi:hypothetical protein